MATWDTGAMQVSISARPDGDGALARLRAALADVPRRIVACSGGVDSLVLAVVAHRESPTGTVVAHTVTPAVPGDGTARVVEHAGREGWALRLVRSGEFDDERYLANPTDRCYHCKSHLYDALGAIRPAADGAVEPAPGGGHDRADGAGAPWVVVSGANVDDLGEYRPGLVAASERDVAHPYVAAGLTKAEVRAVARRLDLAVADLPASPCLASRLYTGTRVTPSRLRAVEVGEALVRRVAGVDVVRCRVRGDEVLVEVPDAARHLVDDDLLASLASTMRAVEPGLRAVRLDDEAYRPGRSFVGAGAPSPS